MDPLSFGKIELLAQIWTHIPEFSSNNLFPKVVLLDV